MKEKKNLGFVSEILEKAAIFINEIDFNSYKAERAFFFGAELARCVLEFQ